MVMKSSRTHSLFFASGALIFFLMLLTLPQAYADVRISKSILAAKKINLKAFAIGGLSGDGRVLTGYEKITDVALKAKGFVYKLWIMEFPEGCDDKPEKVLISDVMLPITEFQQFWISNDGKTVLITANRGAKFLTVDVPSKRVSVIFDHVKGQSGFRSDPGLIHFYHNAFHILGYFYNEKDQLTTKGMATVDLNQTGSAIFKLAYDTKELEGLNPWYMDFVSPSSAFILIKNKKTRVDTLYFYENGKKKELDQSNAFVAEAAAANRIVYSLNRNKKTPECLIRDGVTGKTWKLSSGNKTFQYLFISRDKGDTVLYLWSISSRTG